MSRKGWAILIAVVAALAAAWYAALPLITFQALARAGRNGDPQALEALVDFPALRANLKEQLSVRLLGAIGKDRGLSDSPFGALGALLAPSVVDSVVEAAVTPDGVVAMLRSGRAPLSDLSRGKTALPPPPDTAAPEPAVVMAKPKSKVRFAYAGFGVFKATPLSTEGRHAPLTWVLERAGPFAWKLTGIELPPA